MNFTHYVVVIFSFIFGFLKKKSKGVSKPKKGPKHTKMVYDKKKTQALHQFLNHAMHDAKLIKGLNAQAFHCYRDSFVDTVFRFEIKKVAMFFAQCCHESDRFRFDEENLNYSQDALWRVFRKYFKSYDECQKYARNPRLIANRVYGYRMGNNDDGDGYLYRGRGYIQMTGKNNYDRFIHYLKQNAHTDLRQAMLAEDYCDNGFKHIEGSCQYKARMAFNWLSAGYYWWVNDLDRKKNIKSVTIAINGGLNGLDDREKIYKSVASYFVEDIFLEENS